MKLSLTVEADAINVLALNMGRIVVDIDGIELATLQRHDGSNSDWILYTGHGYLLRLSARLYPVLELKRMGLSKDCRRLVTTLIRRYGIDILHLDAAGDLLPGFATFDW